MKNITIMASILMLVCCGEVDANNNAGSYSDYSTKATYNDIVEINLDDLTFEEAFRIEYLAKGQGDTFFWRGSEYTTDLAEEGDEFVLYHTDTDYEKMGWVLNNDAPDDTCYYNKWDECGVCGGFGKTTWWRDKDGDGLGDHRESIKACDNPNREDLREGSGDLGVLD